MAVNANDAQLIEQLQLYGANDLQLFPCPAGAYSTWAATPPNVDGPGSVTAEIPFSQCIQSLLTNFETSLDEGLELKAPYGTEFDIDDLIWMVTATKTKAAADAIGAGALSPNEARRKYFGVGPVSAAIRRTCNSRTIRLRALAGTRRRQTVLKAAPAAPGRPRSAGTPTTTTRTKKHLPPR